MFFQITFDSSDPPALARFWATALGYQTTPPGRPDSSWQAHYVGRMGGANGFEDRLFDPSGERPPIWFQAVPESKAGKNRVHLDLYPTGRDDSLTMEQRVAIVESKVDQLVTIGATVERRVREDDPADPVYYVVMHDPEDNEFCIG